MSSQPSAEFRKSAVYLVDSSSYIFRAYYAIRQGLSAPDGTPTHATFGFSQMVLSLLEKYTPHHCVFIWDHKDKGFRHKIFPEYKANRTAPPEDLGIQIDNSKKFLDLLSLPQLDKSGFEADDIIATLVHKNPQVNFVIVTGDKDLLQLVGPRVWCLDTMKDKWSNEAEAEEKFGVKPELISHVQALSGDSVDNIPGAPGIGPKTATDLIRYYGSLDKVLKEAGARGPKADFKPTDKNDPLKGKRLESIAQHIPQVNTSLELVTLNTNAPVDTHYENFHQGPIKREALNEFCQQLGFTKLAEKFSQGITNHRAQQDNENAADSNEKQATPHRPVGSLDFSVHVPRSFGEFERCLKDLAHCSEIALDTETFPLDSRASGNLVGISFSGDLQHGVYVPLRHKHGENLSVPAVLETLQAFLKHHKKLKNVIFQNAKFDIHVLNSEGFYFPEHLQIQDTMIASYVLDPSEAHGMDELSMKYLNYRPKSFEEVLGGQDNFSEVPIDEAAFYSAEDAVVTLHLWHYLSEKLKKEPTLRSVYELLDRPLVPLLAKIEDNGVYLNQERLKKLSGELNADLKDIEKKARQMLADSGVVLADDFNMASPKQIGVILFEKLGLPVIKKTKTGPSTDVSVLEELSNQHPFPQALLEIRELSKLISTYVDALPGLVDARDGRLHTDFSQTIAATGRLASSNPNLQNIPIRTERGRKIRESFVAQKGHLLVSADYSQIELRLLAHMSGDRHLVKAFKEGADIHRRTASLILDKDENAVTDEDRRMAKTINFGIIYGQTAFGLSKQLGIPRGEAQRFIDTYMHTYPGIKHYTQKAVEAARKSGYSLTLTGRRRPIRDISSKNVPLRQFAERMAVNTPLQGTAADLMKAAMLACDEVIGKRYPKAKMILQVHDELLFEVPSADAEGLKALLIEIMEDPSLLKEFGIYHFDVPMKVGASVGHHWGEL